MRYRTLALSLVVVSALSCRSTFLGPAAPIVQPGAPGEPARVITPKEALDLSQLRHTTAEVRFVDGMIVHHAQAVDMTALLPSRTSSEDMQLLARRIELSQRDEIELMREWLNAHGASLSNPDGHQSHDASLMPGMLTSEEMRRLTETKGAEFDRLFLEFMIKHHEGALMMIDELFAAEGAGQQSDIFSFASEAETDQRIEIDRMRAMLEERRK